MKFLIIFLIITLIGPLWILCSREIDFNADWRTANRASSGLAPDPKISKEAIIQVYSARAFSWRGIFSMHMWIAIKPKNAEQYTVYQVIGWRNYSGLPAIMAETDIPDRYWFNQKPNIIFDLRGDNAEMLIPKIMTVVKSYPFPDYVLWPGPNSNTLLAYVARKVPELGLALPANAIGKDFLPAFTFFAKAPSGTGYQFSILGIFGVLLAQKEGLEINILGFVYGISPLQYAIELPGIGQVSLRKGG